MVTRIRKNNLALLKKIAFAASNNQITIKQMVNLLNSQNRPLSSSSHAYIIMVLYKGDKYISRVKRGVYELTPKAHKVLQCQ